MAGAHPAPALDRSAPANPVAPAVVPPGVRVTSRVLSVDVLRGIVMVLMALDHVRDYVTALRVQPENLVHGSVALFATRWVTHFCAPVFSLLAGVGIGLVMARGKIPAAMTRFLVVRGAWLIVLDVISRRSISC